MTQSINFGRLNISPGKQKAAGWFFDFKFGSDGRTVSVFTQTEKLQKLLD